VTRNHNAGAAQRSKPPTVGRSSLQDRGNASFDPKNFLAKVGGGKTILKCEKDEIVFLQGDVSDAIFYIQEGKIKLTVVSDRGKEAVVGLLGAGHFFGESCLNGHPLLSQQLLQLRNVS
jgi:CRP/FNR family transcriptional regulator, cyclic AMP receptor protein